MKIKVSEWLALSEEERFTKLEEALRIKPLDQWMALSEESRAFVLKSALMVRKDFLQQQRKPAYGTSELSDKKIVWITSKCSRSVHLEQ